MPQKFVNLENLTSFWGNAKEYIGNERKEIEDQLYNWQKTEKAPIVQCEPVPNSDLHSVVNFSFAETPPASGEKGPENPSTITGVSSVKVTRAGVNILPVIGEGTTATGSIGSVSYTKNGDGTYTFSGTASSNGNTSGAVSARWNLLALGFPKGNYTIGFVENSATVKMTIRITENGTTGYPQATGGSPYSFTIDEGTTDTFVYFQVASGTTYNETATPYLCVGSETVDGPCVSDVYTIQLGDTYYGGSVDLSTGMMTVTHEYLTVNSASAGDTISNGYATFRIWADLFNKPLVAKNALAVCAELPNSKIGDYNRFNIGDPNSGGSVPIWVKLDANLFDFSNAVNPSSPTVTEIRDAGTAYFTQHPLHIVYEIKTPYTVQLTSQQIKSLSSLEGTSKRINTIYTDADSIQVEYQKYVGVDSTLDNTSENAIQNKVVNSALNTKVSLTGDEVIAGSKTFSSPINGSVTGDAGTVAGHIVSKDVPVNAAFTDTTYEPATQSTAGLMSASDKAKLDAVGSVFSFKGSVTDSSSLPVSDNASGDAYLAEDTGHVHVYDGSSFVDIGTWAGIPSATDAQIDALFED